MVTHEAVLREPRRGRRSAPLSSVDRRRSALANRCTCMDIAELETNAERAASLLKSMGSPRRLLILCQLVEGEKAVGELEKAVGLSQSALSQHLAILRHKG